jgi:hypothetical protein
MQPRQFARWGCRSLLICSLVFAAPLALAEDAADRIRALEKRLEEGLKLIEKLSARVGELERSTAAAVPSATQSARLPEPASNAALVAPQAESITALQEDVRQLSESVSRRNAFELGLPLHGFADVVADWSSSGDPARRRGFGAGTLDLYLTPQFGERVRSLIEIAIEYEPAGSGTIDLERLQLGYMVDERLTLWLGRFHSPYGIWNTAFHHGANLQTSISRPRFIDFEDKSGVLPDHSVGLWGSGGTPLGGGKVTYDLYVANGPKITDRTLNPNSYADDGNGAMTGFNLGYQPGAAMSGLSFGVHGFAMRVSTYSPQAATLARTNVRMGGFYAGYDGHDWEVIAEYYRFRNRDAESGVRHNSTAWFAQVGRTFGQTTPYARYESASLDATDPFFATQRAGRSYTRLVLGARYALDSRASFKLELSSSRERGTVQLDEYGAPVFVDPARYRRAGFQYSIAF